jgi:hypothetical protein
MKMKIFNMLMVVALCSRWHLVATKDNRSLYHGTVNTAKKIGGRLFWCIAPKWRKI